MKQIYILVISLTMLINQASALTIEQKMQSLDYISRFSQSMCTQVPFSGRSNTIQLNAEAKAEFNNLIKYFINLGVGVSAQASYSEYYGIMQKDLLSALKYNDSCRKNYYDSLIKLFKLDNPVVTSEIDLGRKVDTFKIKREDGMICETIISQNGSFSQKCQ